MKKGGGKARRVFDKYNIIDDKDLRRAAEQRRLFVQIQNGKGDNQGDNQAGFIP